MLDRCKREVYNKGTNKREKNKMNKHDKQEIENLKSFKKWYLWFLSASEEEKREYLKNRWKNAREEKK